HVTGHQVEGALGVRVREHRPGPDHLTALEDHAGSGLDLTDGHPGGDHRAGVTCGIGEVTGDTAHAALDVPPAPEQTQPVVGVDPRGPGVARAGEGADDSLAVERSPESLVA